MKSEKNVSRAGVFAGILAGLCAGAFAPTASATVYTVLNPSFESPSAAAGDVAGSTNWLTVAGGAFTSTAAAHTGTQAGKAFGNPGLYQQTVNVSDPIGTSYTASVFALHLSADPLTGTGAAFINIDFLNSSGSVITTVTSGEEGSLLASTDPKDVWKQLAVTAPSVAGTTAIRIDLVMGPYNGTGAGGGAAFFDDAALTSAAVPEPASLGALGIAGAALICRRRQA